MSNAPISGWRPSPSRTSTPPWSSSSSTRCATSWPRTSAKSARRTSRTTLCSSTSCWTVGADGANASRRVPVYRSSYLLVFVQRSWTLGTHRIQRPALWRPSSPSRALRDRSAGQTSSLTHYIWCSDLIAFILFSVSWIHVLMAPKVYVHVLNFVSCCFASFTRDLLTPAPGNERHTWA